MGIDRRRCAGERRGDSPENLIELALTDWGFVLAGDTVTDAGRNERAGIVDGRAASSLGRFAAGRAARSSTLKLHADFIADALEAERGVNDERDENGGGQPDPKPRALHGSISRT